MNEARESLEERSRALFRDSVDGLDFNLRSRLTQARKAAVEAASGRRSRGLLMPWFRLPSWAPVAGVSAVALLGAALWFGPMGPHAGAAADASSNLEDLDLVASSDEGSGDAMDMLQDDIDFYDWANTAANSGPAA